MTVQMYAAIVFIAMLLIIVIQYLDRRWLKSRKDYFEGAFKDQLKKEEEQREHYSYIESENGRYKDSEKRKLEEQKNQSPDDIDWDFYDSPKLQHEKTESITTVQPDRSGDRKPTGGNN